MAKGYTGKGKSGKPKGSNKSGGGGNAKMPHHKSTHPPKGTVPKPKGLG